MKSYVKDYNDKITSKLLIKDMLIAFLITVLILTNGWFEFSGPVQWFFSVPVWWFAVTGFMYSFDNMSIERLSKVLNRNINEQILEERMEVEEDEDEKSLA